MTPEAYMKLALRTMAPQGPIRQRIYDLGEKATQIENASRGMINDAGEVGTAVQRWLEYGKPLDEVNLKEELGDVMWRVAQMCDALGITLVEVMEANIRKLAARYGDKYTDFKADEDNRDREAERKAVDKAKWPTHTATVEGDGLEVITPLVEEASKMSPADFPKQFLLDNGWTYQTNWGWFHPTIAEGPKSFEVAMSIQQKWTASSSVKTTVTTEPIVSFGDGLVRDEPVGGSYNRACTKCGKLIHKNNAANVCPDCFADSRAAEKGIVRSGPLPDSVAEEVQ